VNTSPGGHRARVPHDRSTSLLDLPAVPQRRRVNHRHIRGLVAEGRIPYLKWGHLLRLDEADIEAWLDAARKGR
jgi:excisionase family DNA binding protein